MTGSDHFRFSLFCFARSQIRLKIFPLPPRQAALRSDSWFGAGRLVFLSAALLFVLDVTAAPADEQKTMAASPVVIAASAKHTATVIFLHGLGDTGHGWASAMAAVRPPHVKVICPTAPTMPVTLNAGFKMPSWFDLRSLDANGPEDEDGIKKACDMVHKMIDEELKEGISSERIVIGGFSQGGALALYSALKYNKTLGGVMALSCWLPMHRQFPAAACGNLDIPYLQCHGDCDPVVPYKWGQATATLLKQFLKKAEFKTYRGMMHSSSDEEMRDLKKFAEANLPPN